MAYDYGAKEPEKLKIKDMTSEQKKLLIDSDTFCMMPWLHLHAFPDGRAYPCCLYTSNVPCKVRFLGIFIGASTKSFVPSSIFFKCARTSLVSSFLTSFPDMGEYVLPIRANNNLR